MADFQELYCIIHRCEPGEFSRRVFCACFSRKALLPARWLLALNLFHPEQELIAALGRTTDEIKFREELHYFTNRRSLSWWRQRTGLRVSTRRLRALGEACFAMGSAEQRSSPMAA